MDFTHLTELFDGTVFADDYRTNLKAARERIAALEVQMSANDQMNAKSGLLLAQAVYFSICGDFTNANSYLGQLSRIAQSNNDNSLLSRCAAYEVHIRCMQNVPPLLRFRVDRDSGPAIVRDIGIPALCARVIRKRSERGNQGLSQLEKFEADVLRSCRSFLNELWISAFPEHPQYFKNHSIVLFREDRNFWDDVRQPEGENNFQSIASYLHKLTLQYLLAGDASNARSSIWSIYGSVLERGDLIAAANCQIQLGDAILSPPFTSPFALNLVSVVREIGWANDMWDKKEQRFPLKRDAEAIQCYQQAHFLFEAGGSERGRAAVLLRYACLDIADAIVERTHKDAKSEQHFVQSAKDHLKAAKELFEGDITNSLIVKGHLATCNIILRDITTALELCFDIGFTSKCTGNTCTGEFIGMMHLRLAKKLALDESRAQEVLALCACATVCFRGLDDPYLELHAVAASARFHRRKGNIPVAMKHVKHGRKLLELTVTYFDSLKGQVENLRISHEDQEQTWLYRP
ncbi:hypothetical protein BKA66DRAFT_611522 [Pyrenochaeta sp. MPI-SDFR-AT-0127]|nr:hypothetical protein BKA66DRAFT_611522 [Pyrenochaeta sp. MPI-SDFR-AT-0127]